MPQIDTVTYFPIIFWSLLIICLGFIFFNLYLFLNLVSMMKLPNQWKNYQVSLYWINWNTVEILDTLAQIQVTAAKLRNYNLDDSSDLDDVKKFLENINKIGK